MSFRLAFLPLFATFLTTASPAAATPIASALTTISEPRVCGSVCIPAVNESNAGDISNGILSSFVGGGDVFAEARIDLANGTAGVAVNNTIGTSHAEASHTDTWFCASQPTCAALAGGGFVPVTLNLHVEGSGSLTPSGGFMDLVYTYDTASLLGSSALGQFRFEFFEDPGLGLHANIQGNATFIDYHTGIEHHPTVHLVTGFPIDNQIAFGMDFTVSTFIGGCAGLPCNLTGGVFTDTQSLTAETDAASDGLPEGLNSLDTFRVSIASGLPFVSADGRTVSDTSASPEPGSLGLMLAGAILLGALRARYRYQRRLLRRLQ